MNSNGETKGGWEKEGEEGETRRKGARKGRKEMRKYIAKEGMRGRMKRGRMERRKV